MRECFPIENFVRRSGCQYGGQASRQTHATAVSCPGLRLLAQLAEEQLITFHLHFEPVQRPWRRSGKDPAFDRKERVMAGADKLSRILVPMVGTAKVRALRLKR